MINEDIYNNFTDEQKEAFDKAAEDGKVAERQISQELASSARATMEAEGVVFTDVNKDDSDRCQCSSHHQYWICGVIHLGNCMWCA